MADAQEIFDQLSHPFPIDYIQWRVGPTNAKSRKEGDALRGQPLCYIDSRAVMDRLDSVCGPAGWQDNYTPGVQGSIVCNIGICLDGEWLWKADGAGATDMEADKGALSDAFKRAAVRWGVGRYLYDLKSPWIVLEQRGNTPIIPDTELRKLNELHEDFAQKAGWGLRSGIQAYKLLNSALKTNLLQQTDVEHFRATNAGMIAQLPVAMRRHLQETLDRIGASQREAAE